MGDNYPAKVSDNEIEMIAHNIITLIALDIFEEQKQELVSEHGADVIDSAYEYCIAEYKGAIDNIKRIYNQYK